jgi:serine protease Do
MYAGRWVLTNRHVVEAVNTIVVRNGLGEVRLVERVILSEKADLAILVLEEAYPAAYSLSDESLIEPKAGDEIYVIGYPLSSILGRYNPSITEGIVSKATGFGEKRGGFQLTAKVNPGNSGGPIINSKGQLVGVTVGRLDKQQVMEEEGFIPADVNLGIPASTIRDFLEMPEEETIKTAAEYDATEIYEYMRAAVVLVVGQK